MKQTTLTHSSFGQRDRGARVRKSRFSSRAHALEDMKSNGVRIVATYMLEARKTPAGQTSTAERERAASIMRDYFGDLASILIPHGGVLDYDTALWRRICNMMWDWDDADLFLAVVGRKSPFTHDESAKPKASSKDR